MVEDCRCVDCPHMAVQNILHVTCENHFAKYSLFFGFSFCLRGHWQVFGCIWRLILPFRRIPSASFAKLLLRERKEHVFYILKEKCTTWTCRRKELVHGNHTCFLHVSGVVLGFSVQTLGGSEASKQLPAWRGQKISQVKNFQWGATQRIVRAPEEAATGFEPKKFTNKAFSVGSHTMILF